MLLGSIGAMGETVVLGWLTLELTNAAMHYSLYLAATVILRMIMGMEPHWNVIG